MEGRERRRIGGKIETEIGEESQKKCERKERKRKQDGKKRRLRIAYFRDRLSEPRERHCLLKAAGTHTGAFEVGVFVSLQFGFGFVETASHSVLRASLELAV